MNIASLSLVRKSELVHMRELITLLESQINIATDFVREIEKGNWSAGDSLGIGTSSASSALTDSLLSLCNQLQSYSLAEKERNWVTEGLAQFIDILRSKNEEIHELTDNIIRSLVKYMNVNQGALYLINDDNANDIFIEMAACYAYNRKKHMEHRINIGEGLAGQAVLEKDTIYLSDIPKDYVKITSGLGDALPNHILIVPLKIEEKVFGVVEVAAFEAIPKYRIEFVEKLGESIASTLANVKNGQKTQILLQQSITQTEMMRSQEEEMRQNMEELNATQEEIQRVLKGVQNKEKYLNEIINAPKDSIYILDKDYKVLSYNKMFGAALEQTLGTNDLKGFSFLDLFPEASERKKQKAYMDRAFAGENFEYVSEYTDKGMTSCYSTNYAPLRDEQGKVYAIAGFSKDITELHNAQKKTEELLNESKQQAEELKTQKEELYQNMEEISATQDEIHRVLNEVQGKERYMNELINATNDSILTVDRTMKVINCNEAFKKSYGGFGFEIGKGFDLNNLFATNEDKKKYASYYERVFNGEHFKVTEEYSFGDINSYFSISYSPIKDEEGTIIAAAVFVNDITPLSQAKKEVEKLLADSDAAYQTMAEKERYLNDIINAPKDSIYILDKEYKILDYNAVFGSSLEQMLGIKDLRGFCLLDLFPDAAERKGQQDLIDKTFTGESIEHTSGYENQGVTSYYCTNYAPLKNAQGEVYAITGFSKDVTALVSAQKRAEELLKESKNQTEEIKTQEEELRQNMEELTTTQEEMQRVFKEMQEKERYMVELINASNDSILTVDKNMVVINCNDTFKNTYSASGLEIGRGFDINLLFANEEDKKKYAAYYKRVFKGESFTVNEEYTFGDISAYYSIQYSPIKDAEGRVIAAAVFVNDKTALANAKKEVEKLLDETNKAYKEMAEKERHLNELINVPNDSIFTIDKDFKVVSFNNSIAKGLEQSGIKLEKGFYMLSILSKEEQDREIANYKKAFKGENLEVVNKIKVGDVDIWFAINYAPLHDSDGNISQIAIFSKDVTTLYKDK